MPALSLASPNQIQSTLGRVPRLSLAAALRDSTGQLYQDRAFQQQQSALEQERQGLDIQSQGLTLAEETQADQQKQQTVGNVISGLGTVGQGALAAKQLGLFGSGTAATTAAAASPSLGAAALGPAAEFAAAEGSGTAGTLLGATPAAVEAGGAAAAGTAGATGAAATGFPALGTLGGAAAAGGAALGGALAGSYTGKAVEEKVGGGFKGKVAGHATGAATGAALGAAYGSIVPGIGNAVGAVAGAIGGGLGASFCPMHSAAFGNESLEVAIARRWRDTQLTRQQLRAYYVAYAPIAARMDRDPAYRRQIRQTLIEPLIRYGAHQMKVAYQPMQPTDQQVAESFLARLRLLGKGMGPVRRQNGEIV